MRQVIHKLDELEALELGATDVHQLVKAVEFKNLLICVRLKFTAGLLREESRGDHYREEFPFRDDLNWLKWITIQSSGKEMIMMIEDVPLEQYPARPAERCRIPAPVQYQFTHI